MKNPLVHIDNLSIYYGQTPAIAGVCLDIEEGEYLGIIGPNGGGKTTLLKAIVGLIPVLSGTVQVFGGESGRENRVSVMSRNWLKWTKSFLLQCGKLF
jgi:zinc transport system ATP-binding protein